MSIEFAPGLFLTVDRPHSSLPVPAIVWLHGGAWRMGDHTWGPDQQQRVVDAGFAVVSIDYRLSSDAVFPAQLFDVRSAVRWVRAHATEHGIDPARIGIWGSSAGGHLASLAGLHGHVAQLQGETDADGSAAVQAVVDGYGPADLLAPDQDVPPTVALLGGPVAERIDVARSASPALADASNAPPFLIMHGLADELIPASQSVELFESLAAAGGEATLYLIEGFGHGFFNPPGESELGPGPKLDSGHLSADPAASASVRLTANGRSASIESAPPASIEVIIDFFTTHLRPSH
jgi:acetyl esterase/lipase